MAQESRLSGAVRFLGRESFKWRDLWLIREVAPQFGGHFRGP